MQPNVFGRLAEDRTPSRTHVEVLHVGVRPPYRESTV